MAFPSEVDAVLYLFKDRVQGCRGMGFVLISVKNGAASGCKALAASFPFPKQASVCRGNMCCCFACSHRFQAKHRICQEAGEIVKQLDQHLQVRGWVCDGRDYMGLRHDGRWWFLAEKDANSWTTLV